MHKEAKRALLSRPQGLGHRLTAVESLLRERTQERLLIKPFGQLYDAVIGKDA